MASKKPIGAKVTDKQECKVCNEIFYYPCNKKWCNHINDLCEQCDKSKITGSCFKCLFVCNCCGEIVEDTGCCGDFGPSCDNYCMSCCNTYGDHKLKTRYKECCYYCKKKKYLISDCTYCRKCAREHCMLSGTDSFTSSA